MFPLQIPECSIADSDTCSYCGSADPIANQPRRATLTDNKRPQVSCVGCVEAIEYSSPAKHTEAVVVEGPMVKEVVARAMLAQRDTGVHNGRLT